MRHSRFTSVAALLAVVLAACGQTTSTPASGQQLDQARQVENHSGNIRVNAGMNPISELEFKSLKQYTNLQDNPNFIGPKVQAQAAQRCSNAVAVGNEGEIRSTYSSQNQYYFSVFMYTGGWTNFHVVIQRDGETLRDYNTPYEPAGYYTAYPGRSITIQVTATGFGYAYGVLQCTT